MHILVVGAGSIGMRHIKNLVELGINSILAVDNDLEKAAIAQSFGENVDSCAGADLDKLCRVYSPDAAIVAVPTHLHMEVAGQLAQHNMPLLIEKPVSHTMGYVLDLQSCLKHYNQWAVIGYSMRFHPAIQIIKDLLPQIGIPLYARAEVGQYLPDWHPEKNYRNWYMAHEDQGGGALLDLSHEIDYMQWLFGPINDITDAGYVDGHKHSDIEADSDLLAEFLCQLGDGVVGSIHMDLLDRSYNRRLRIVGSEGTISWDTNNSVVQRLLPDGECVNYPYDIDRNIQFKEEMVAFVDSVQCGIVHPTLATLEDGIEVLKVALELKKQNGRS